MFFSKGVGTYFFWCVLDIEVGAGMMLSCVWTIACVLAGDINQICMDITLDHDEDLIRLW